MVFPIGDDNSDLQIVPAVNYVLIAINVLVFVVFQGLGENNDFTYKYSTVPAEIRTGQDITSEDRVVVDRRNGQQYKVPGLKPTPVSVYLTLLTSMFMHGGIAHLLGNMWFLWIFGDNIEDRIGHGRYLVFYLVCGLLASLAHVLTTFLFRANPYIPSLGASGAISGVLGAYMLLFPTRRMTVLMARVVTEAPAIVVVGLWFVFQLINGLGMLGGDTGGVAYGAHIGGFLAGLALIKPFEVGLDRR